MLYLKIILVAVHTLVRDELVDSEFLNMARGSTYDTWLLHKANYAVFEQGFHVDKLKERGLLVNIPSIDEG